MPVLEILSLVELNAELKETEEYELGKVVVMVYEEGPVYENLKLVYELISRCVAEPKKNSAK